ncbi:MAG: transglutaminase domain-containing protein [Ignavibacteriae bacterium]|nr:transglutaminase domain-containing protein [Ignavibacteriota bacterium]
MKNIALRKIELSIVLSFVITLSSCNYTQNNSSGVVEDNMVESLDSLLKNDRKAFLHKLTSGLESDSEKAHSIVNWLALNFDWKSTDYKKRNVQQIIERGGGNCNDLAKVATNLMDSAAIKTRKVREINIHIKSDNRQNSAEALVNEKGFKYSVFGMMHNDHVWIEIYNGLANKWIPADPSLGVVGLGNWMECRVTFEKKKTLDPGSEDMIVPIAIFAQDENGKLSINRSEYYLIESFDKIYDNKLSNSTIWKDWSSSIKKIDDECLLAFEGKLNLHLHQAEIKALSVLYEKMKLDFENRN